MILFTINGALHRLPMPCVIMQPHSITGAGITVRFSFILLVCFAFPLTCCMLYLIFGNNMPFFFFKYMVRIIFLTLDHADRLIRKSKDLTLFNLRIGR